jgi:hypothetical protein
MNWIAFNFGTDVSLAGRSGSGTLPFVLLPQLETLEGSRNGTDPEGFRYTIKTRQVAEG